MLIRAQALGNTRLLCTTFLILTTLIACAEPLAPAPEGGNGETMTSPDCPPEFVKPSGECWLDDPSAYNDYVETNGEPTEDELLYVDDEIIQEQESVFLTQDGPGKFYVYVNERRRVGIRAVNNVGSPVPGVRVEFKIEDGVEASDPKGSTLSAQIAETDQYGVASVEVIAGPDPAYFRIVMDSDVSGEIPYGVTVIQPNIRDTSDITTIPPAQRCALIDISGNYEVTNYYELGRFLGDDVFNALDFIHEAVTDPGGLIGNWIRDRIGGWIGDAVRGVVRDIVNSLIRSANFPDWLTTTLNVLQDVTGFLTELEIKANMRFGKVEGPDCDVPGVHTWEQLVFRWQGNDCGAFGGANCGEHIINLTEVGVSVSESEFAGRVVTPSALRSEVEIGEHELQLNIGVVLITLLENVILPQRSGVRSMGELISRLVPCDRFGDLAASLVGGIPIIGGGVRGLATDACRDGVRALGNDLTRQLIGQLNVSTFKVKGRAQFDNIDNMPGIDKIEEGRWEGDPNSNSYLQGSFSGTPR